MLEVYWSLVLSSLAIGIEASKRDNLGLTIILPFESEPTKPALAAESSSFAIIPPVLYSHKDFVMLVRVVAK
jgi:hypothetical protein